MALHEESIMSVSLKNGGLNSASNNYEYIVLYASTEYSFS